MANDEMACWELVELVTLYFEGALPAADRALFEAHLQGCDGCTQYLDQARRAIVLTGSLPPGALAPGAGDELLHLFREWKHSQPAAGA
jgi:hypothetical protein